MRRLAVTIAGIATVALAVVSGLPARASATADLQIQWIFLPGQAGHPPATAGQPFQLTIEITNSGPDPSHFRVQIHVPAGVHYVSGQGCTGTGADLTCDDGTAPSGFDGSGGITFATDKPGDYTFGAQLAELTATDPNPANNQASVSITVGAGEQALTAGKVNVAPAKPRAGVKFVASVRVTDKNSGTGVAPTGARCTASPGRARARVAGERAVCTVTTPRAARGRVVRGTLTAIIGDRRLSKRFSVRLG